MNQAIRVNGVNVDPVIPNEFWSFIPIAKRPKNHLKWLEKAFILTVANPHFPGGNRYDVYCLEDGGTSDRPSVWGMFGTLEEAVERAKEGPPWRVCVRMRGENSSKKVCENLHSQSGHGFSETG